MCPLGAGDRWSFSHVCVFEKEVSLPEAADKLAVLGELIKTAKITGFARITEDPDLP